VEVFVDCAGAAMGGAKRFLNELVAWLGRHPEAPVRLLGQDRAIGARHLVAREIPMFGRRPDRAVALNNVGFVGTAGERWVLLRNPLHFVTPAEAGELPRQTAQRMRTQTRIVRLAARRADVIVVPSSEMGERVRAHLPTLADRLVVMPHPLSPRPRHQTAPGLVVCPVLLAPWKGMSRHLDLLESAVRELRSASSVPLDVRVTATKEELAALGHGNECVLRPVGRLPAGDLDKLLSRAQVIYYPTTIESFGYPLAEARANGQPVVGHDTQRTREVAGQALVPFAEQTPQAVATALYEAVEKPPPPPDPGPFSPDIYFGRWLA